MASEHDAPLPEAAMPPPGDHADEVVVPAPPPPSGPAPVLGGRLHPAAVAVNGMGQLLPLVFLVFAGPFALPMVLGIGSIGFVVAGLQWYRFTWRVDAEGLVIEQGLLQRKRRVMPLGRIQSVESVRKLRHRLFGVTALRVESVGGEESEGRLEALDPQLAEHVRRVLLRRAPAAPTAAHDDVDDEGGEQLVRLDFGQLVAAGVTGGRVGIAAAILGFGQELWLDPLLSRVDDQVLDSAARNVTLVLGVIAVAVLALFVISVFATALVFWDFTLLHRGDTLGVRRGLLEQRSDTIPLQRIQAVRIEENVVRRLLGLAAVRIEIAGRSGGGGDVGGQTDVVLPIGRRQTALALADRLLDSEEPVAGRPLTSMPTAARTRRIVRALVTGGLFFLPALIDVRLAWIGVLVTAVGLALAFAAYRSLGWASTDDHMLAQSGVVVRRRWVVPAPAVQSAQVTVTPFQRRRGLASLSLEIARSGNAGDPTMHDLADAEAARLLDAAAAHSTAAGRAQVAAQRRRLDAGRPVSS